MRQDNIIVQLCMKLINSYMEWLNLNYRLIIQCLPVLVAFFAVNQNDFDFFF